MARESVDGILLHGDLFMPVKLSKGETKCLNSKFQNHSGPLLCHWDLEMCSFLFFTCKTECSQSSPYEELIWRRLDRWWKWLPAVSVYLALVTLNSLFYIKPWSLCVLPSIHMTHIDEGGKYVGPKHHRKYFCQQGAEVILIKMFSGGTGCPPNES